MKNTKGLLLSGLCASVATLAIGVNSAKAEDKYLRTLEDRVIALEQELRGMKATKGSDMSKQTIEPTMAEVPTYVIPKSKYVEEVKLRGRIQFQWGYTSADVEDGRDTEDYSTFEMRRLRFGVEGKIKDGFKYLVEFNVRPQDLSLDQAWLQYTANELAMPIVGQMKPRFSSEENTSSASIITIERSVASDLYKTDPLLGAAIEGKLPGMFSFINYSAGIFDGEVGTRGSVGETGAAVANGNAINAGNNDVEYLYNGSVGFDFTGMIPVEGLALDFRVDYNHNEDRGLNLAENAAFKYEDAMAASAHIGYGPFDFRAEYFASDLFDRTLTVNSTTGAIVSTVENDNLAPVLAAGQRRVSLSRESEGYTFLASYFIIPQKLQLVARYEHSEVTGDEYIAVNSKGAITAYSDASQNQIALPGRYASRSKGLNTSFTPGQPLTNVTAGNEYEAVYAGVNWYIHGNDLKIMVGAEWATLSDNTPSLVGGKLIDVKDNVDTFTLWTALRMQF